MGWLILSSSDFITIPPPQLADRLKYQAAAHLREGVWECPKLPFFVNELSADVAIEDGILSIKRAQGANGLTILRGGDRRRCATRLARRWTSNST